MANSEQFNFFKQCVAAGREGIDRWNAWREENSELELDFTNIDFRVIDLNQKALANRCIIHLGRVNFSGANLSNVDLSDLIITMIHKFNNANIMGTNFAQKDLSNVDFSSLDLSEASLFYASLRKANFCNADLSNTDLSQANLREADLRGANLSGADLRGADLSEADLSDANLSGADLTDLSEDSTLDFNDDAVVILKTHTSLQNAKFNGANLSGADLSGLDLRQIDLRETIIDKANLSGSNLENIDFHGKHFIETDFSNANLNGANLSGTVLKKVNLSNAHLNSSNLSGAILDEVNLSSAYLNRTNLVSTQLIKSDLSGAYLCRTRLTLGNLTGCRIYGISAWDVELDQTIQKDLVITNAGEPEITVDNLEVAQFIYLLLNNVKIRSIIDTITSKVVLILGRFTDKRKSVLDALREELRLHNLTPILFDFERPINRDLTETVRTLAHLSRFVIADITEPSSVPHELQNIVPELEVPVWPLLEASKDPYSMFQDLRKHTWLFPIFHYENQASLIASLKDKIIDPANKKAQELAEMKAKRLSGY